MSAQQLAALSELAPENLDKTQVKLVALAAVNTNF